MTHKSDSELAELCDKVGLTVIADYIRSGRFPKPVSAKKTDREYAKDMDAKARIAGLAIAKSAYDDLSANESEAVQKTAAILYGVIVSLASPEPMVGDAEETKIEALYDAGWSSIRQALERANPGIKIEIDGRARYRLRELFLPKASQR